MIHSIGDCFYWPRTDCFSIISGIDKFNCEYQAYFEYSESDYFGENHPNGTGYIACYSMDSYLERGVAVKLRNNSEQEKFAARLKYAK